MKYIYFFSAATALSLCVGCNNTTTPEQNPSVKQDTVVASATPVAPTTTEKAVQAAPSNQLKSVKVFQDSDYKLLKSAEFAYDVNGCLAAVKSSKDAYTISYKRDNNDSLVVLTSESNKKVQTYKQGVFVQSEQNGYGFDVQLKDGKVVDWKGREFGFAKGYEWKDGNMAVCNVYDEQTVTTYKYSYGELKNQWNFDLIEYLDVFDEQEPEKFGPICLNAELLSKNLPVAINYSFEEEGEDPVTANCTIKYKLDSQNRVDVVTVVKNRGKESSTKRIVIQYAD